METVNLFVMMPTVTHAVPRTPAINARKVMFMMLSTKNVSVSVWMQTVMFVMFLAPAVYAKMDTKLLMANASLCAAIAIVILAAIRILALFARMDTN